MFWASSDTTNYLESDTALIETISNAKYSVLFQCFIKGNFTDFQKIICKFYVHKLKLSASLQKV